MSKATDGIELTRVGPGTVMGDLMRCYWIPALMSSELVRDGAPVRLMLLGEKLIAFRDSAGRVGVMDHRCPHRCASLFLGRNEEEGIRCIYHGWKFDVAGNCVDMPSLPPPGFKEKVKAKAYKVVERAGVVWVYMGTRAEAPPLPAFEILDLPEDEVKVTFIQRDCNYLQALEGEIDTSHFGFLHAGHVDPDDLSEDEPVRNTVINRAPEYHLADTDGARSTPATAMSAAGRTYWRFGNFLFPFWSQAPNGEFGTHMHARGWVPLDDEHTMFVFLSWKKAVHARFPAAARLQGRLADRRHRARQQAVAEHDRLARALAHGGQCGQRLGDRPRRPSRATRSTAGSTASICRTRRSPRAWDRSSTTSSSISRRRTR